MDPTGKEGGAGDNGKGATRSSIGWPHLTPLSSLSFKRRRKSSPHVVDAWTVVQIDVEVRSVSGKLDRSRPPWAAREEYRGRISLSFASM